MRKKIAQILSILFISVSTFGLGSCSLINELKLAKIERQGEYIIRQGLRLNQGTKHINLYDQIKRKVYKDKGYFSVTKGQEYDFYYCEKGGEIYFVYCYAKDVDRERMNSQKNSFHTVNYYAYGKVSIIDVSVTLSGYFESAIEYSSDEMATVGFLGDYAVFRSYYAEKLFIFDCDTMQMREIFVEGFEYDDYCDSAVTLSKIQEDSIDYRIYDENLMEYQYTYTGEAMYCKPFEDYLVFYDYDRVSSGYSMESVVNFKTNSVLNEDNAALKWQEFRVNQQSSIKNYDFSYKGKQYTFGYDSGIEDENSENEAQKSNVLTITDIQTGQKYSITNEELFALAPAMSQIQEIYDEEFDCWQIIAQENDLYFVFVSGEINQGIGLSNISQRIVFKFNESSKQLDYIGYGFYKFCNITGIYQGKL